MPRSATCQKVQNHPEWGTTLQRRGHHWRDGLEQAGWSRPPGSGPILPLLIGADADALRLQQTLEESGLLSIAIRPPTVPEGAARLRLVLRRDLPDDTLGLLLRALSTG